MSFKYAAYYNTFIYADDEKKMSAYSTTTTQTKKHQHRVEGTREKIVTQTYRDSKAE